MYRQISDSTGAKIKDLIAAHSSNQHRSGKRVYYPIPLQANGDFAIGVLREDLSAGGSAMFEFLDFITLQPTGVTDTVWDKFSGTGIVTTGAKLYISKKDGQYCYTGGTCFVEQA